MKNKEKNQAHEELQNTQHMVLRNRPTLFIGTERLACLNSHPGVQLGTLAFFCTLPSSFAPSPPKPTKVLGLIKLKKKKSLLKNWPCMTGPINSSLREFINSLVGELEAAILWK